MKLCVSDLAELTGGGLRMANMPPLDGPLAPIHRIVLSPQSVAAGDVYWRLVAEAGDAQAAYFRGALGVVHAGAWIEPWPGRFSLQVDDVVGALRRFIERVLDGEQEFFSNRSELKVLQLCAAGMTDISSPTCGRSAKGQTPDRCRRQAA